MELKIVSYLSKYFFQKVNNFWELLSTLLNIKILLIIQSFYKVFNFIQISQSVSDNIRILYYRFKILKKQFLNSYITAENLLIYIKSINKSFK